MVFRLLLFFLLSCLAADYPPLRHRAFWDTSELPAARALEAAFPTILAECTALMQGNREATFAKYHSRVVSSGGWSDVQFFAGCKRDVTHCGLCPRTAAVIEGQPRLNSVIFGSHFFSVRATTPTPEPWPSHAKNPHPNF